VRANCDARGNVSVLVAAIIAVAMLLCTAFMRLGGAAVDKSRANTAADAAALAGADRLALGRTASEACSIARSTALANGARLLVCSSDPSAIQVTVAVAGARSRARAEFDPSRIPGTG